MARIFIAIRFNEEFKQTLVGLQEALKNKSVEGNYCPYGNLHMTLAFIGEDYDLTEIHRAISEVEFAPFTITLDKLGMFPTKAGVIWCGIKEQTEITALADKIRERLTAHDISFNTKMFVPHISLVQHPSLVVTDIEVPKVTIRIERIFVLKSERIDGKLIYSEYLVKQYNKEPYEVSASDIIKT